MGEERDRRYMALALRLARRGLGNVWPNPAVGCVIVKDGRMIGRGWTQPGGRPHAETVALEQAGAGSRGATAYVSLEPCSHHGETPPCAEALIAFGVARVVAAVEDPDPRVRGQGLEKLRAAGIEVEAGTLGDAAESLNAGFFSRVRRGRPLVAMKLATSLDGRIATATGHSQWITGQDARAWGHYLRAGYDAILTGMGTVIADNPSMTCRLPGMAGLSPVRVVLDGQGRLDPETALAASADEVPVWRYCASGVEATMTGVKTITVPMGEDGLDLAAVLSDLSARGITRLLVEAGARLSGAFLRAKLVDRLYWFRAPMVLGGDGLSVFDALDIENLADAAAFSRIDSRLVGKDLFEIYDVQA